MDTAKGHPHALVVCIDATNLRRGGGVTHLVELLTAAEPARQGITKVVVWGGRQTLAKLPDRPWLAKENPPALNRGLIRRSWWQRFNLSRAAQAAECSVLFVPGGSYAGSFCPIVTMSRNLLPFEWPELLRYRVSLTTLKLLLLRYTQTRSFREADGVIFLTDYAKAAVLKVTGELRGNTVTIPHGVSPRFQIQPKSPRTMAAYTEERPCRLLYVSIIDQYKHQWHIVEAVSALRKQGYPVVLELVGPAYPPALRRLQTAIVRFDPEGSWVRYHGAVPHETLHQIYAEADIGIFASSCENMPNILLETMAAGLPVACSNRGPMPEVVGDGGLLFDPLDPADIARAIREFVLSSSTRSEKVAISIERAKEFSWERCADQTFSFLATLARAHQ